MAGTADKILEHLLETRIGKECDMTGICSSNDTAIVNTGVMQSAKRECLLKEIYYKYDGRISTHADLTSIRRAILIGTRLRELFPP